MVKTLSVNIEKVLDDETACKNFQDDLVSRSKNIDQKIIANTECKDEINLYKSRLAKEIDEHIQSELNRVAKLKKAEIYKDLEKIFQDLEKNISSFNLLGIEVKKKLETEIKSYQNVVNTSKQSIQNRFENNIQNINEDLDFEEDALTINESMNEFSETTRDSQINQLENIFKNIDQIADAETKFLKENFQQKVEAIEFIKRSVRHEEFSFGHLKNPESQVIDQLKLQLDTVLNKTRVFNMPSESFELTMNDTNAHLRTLKLQCNEPEPRSIFNRASLPAYSNLIDTTLTFEKKFSNSISVGRGRLLKNLNNPISKETNQPKNHLSLNSSQKRKSPSYQSDLNNNQIVDIEVEEIRHDSVMNETSSKLKKSNTMHLSRESNDQVDATFQINVCVLSNHIRKHTRAISPFSLLNDNIPPLQAKFVGKYADLKFPIGVRICVKRNWLIVCDCGSDVVKIFEKTATNLLRTIGSCSEYKFERPSALLIDNETGDKLYVKDDKQIVVFNLNNDCSFIQKFGFNILQRPYGLTFNSEGHLVVVDTNPRGPVIHMFNKMTGELIKSSPYQPAIFRYSNSSTLNSMYYENRANLIPFEKSKIRFINCYQNYIYASDLGRSIVFKTTLDGQTELAFGTFGKMPGQMNEPSGIHVDYDGKAVLVGDSKNNRLQIFDDNGKYKCGLEFIDEKIIRPSDIHIDAEGYLYVVCYIQHCIKKFKLI